MADTLQTIRDYASSLNGDERQSFMDKFNSIKGDDTKVSTLANRIQGKSNSVQETKPKSMMNSITRIPGVMANSLNQDLIQPVMHPFDTIQGIGKAMFDHPIDNIVNAAKNITPQGTMDYLTNHPVGTIMNASALAGGAGAGLSAIGKANGIESMANVGKGLMDAAQVPGKSIAEMTKGAISPIVNNIITPKNLDSHIVSTYSQAINPSIAKVTNAGKLDEFQSKTVNAMKTIADNQSNLKFENPQTGQMEARLPKSRIETFDALNQTKQNIYDQYNALQKSATDKGAMVDVPSIANKAFSDIKNSRQYKLYEPGMAQDADRIMEKLSKSGLASPQDVQDDIAFLNQKMKGYYQKGDFNAANIYANYAANLRTGLDSSIEKALDQGGYQDLKNKYSSLKYVEGDLAKAAARELKNTGKGIGESFSNPIALAEMARGLFTGSPAEFGTGLAIKGFSTLQKALNNPDWRISNMFKNISKLKGK